MVQSIEDARRHARSSTPGRVPPHNLAAEESLLGAMLLSKDAISSASIQCSADDFYKPAHGHVFEAVLSLSARGEPADPVTVADELRRAGLLDAIGGPAVLVGLQANTPATSNATTYAKIVEEHARLRRLIAVAGEIAELGYSLPEDVEAAIDKAESLVFDVADRRVTDSTVVLRELLYRSLERIEALFGRNEEITGVPTGFYDIDEKLSGLQPSSLVIVGARPAMGKALALDTPLPTPQGWTTMGDVEPGDEVFDETGRPCRVEYCSPVFLGDECYLVAFDDGTSIVADAGHRWLAYDLPAWKSLRERHRRLAMGPPANPSLARDQTVRYRLPRVLTTVEMRNEGVRVDGRPNWFIPVAGALDLPEVDLPVDPYVLGCWLGAGGSSGASSGASAGASAGAGLTIAIAGTDAAHFGAELEARGYGLSPRSAARLGATSRAGSAQWDGSPPRVLADELRVAGLLDGAAKHIPQQYMRSSAKQRLELLQGLLDTDGTVINDNGTVELGLVDRDLLLQVWELVASLGHRPLPIQARSITLPDGRSSTAWRFAWTPTDPVFRLERKARRLALPASTGRGRHARRAIVSIEPVPTVPVRCIAVDSPSHLFLAGAGMTPTHNTAFALGIAANAAVKAQVPVLFFSLEMGHLEITSRLLCAEAMVDSTRLRNGKLLESDWPRITGATSRLGEAPLYVDDNPNLTMLEVRAKARRLKGKTGLGLIIIDYLQLMTGRNSAENRQVEIAEMSRGLKILARELQVPVVALSQLSRTLESRADKRPMLSDLRESGCLTGDTRVLRADTGAEVTMSELLVSGERDIPVWTLDADHRMVRGIMTHVFPSGIKPVFALKLASGRVVKASANHPFLTADGWRRLDELEPHGRVAVPRVVPAPADVRSWNPARITLLAHLLGDATGYLRRPLQCRTSDPAVLRAVLDASRALRSVAVGSPSGRVSRQGNWSSVRLSPDHPALPDPIWDWLDGLGLAGLRAREWFIPAGISALPLSQLALFLRHLWSSGGALAWKGGRADISLVTAGRRMAEDVQLLLARFGIWTRVARASGDHPGAGGWEVVVDTPASQRRFLDEINAFGVHMRRMPLLLTKLPPERDGIGEVPFDVWDQLRPQAIEEGRRDPALAHTIGFVRSHALPGPGRRGVLEAATAMHQERVAHMMGGDVAWDRIVEIVELGEEPVYDATVIGTHNFVANGIAVHNSLEQDADVVMFIYRDEVYNAETNDKGAAEIIVAKHRNGPTGTSRLVFQDRYTRFDNAARGA